MSTTALIYSRILLPPPIVQDFFGDVIYNSMKSNITFTIDTSWKWITTSNLKEKWNKEPGFSHYIIIC